jgi:hypothetical protein
MPTPLTGLPVAPPGSFASGGSGVLSIGFFGVTGAGGCCAGALPVAGGSFDESFLEPQPRRAIADASDTRRMVRTMSRVRIED